MKLVVNGNFGGFSIPDALIPPTLVASKSEYGSERYQAYLACRYADVKRDDQKFVAAIEALSENDREDLRVVEIPDGSFWTISDYDGSETVYFSASEIYLA